MASLGEGSLGSFQLGLIPTVAELSPLLTSSTVQGDLITRKVENSGLILSNTFESPLYDGTQNLARSGGIVESEALDYQSTQGIVVNSSPLLRELSGTEGPNIGEDQLGSFQLGADKIGDGMVFEAFADTKASAGNIFRPRVINVGRGVSRKFVTGEMPLTTSIQILEESIARKIDGDVLNLTVDKFLSDVFAKAVAGDTIQSTAQIIEATRLLTEWALGQRQLGRTLEEVREWEVLELVYRYTKDSDKVTSSDYYTVHEATNDLKSQSEKVSLRNISDGGFRSIDLSSGNASWNIQSPDERRDVRPVDTWYVESIESENISTDGDSYDVTVELVPEVSKQFDNKYGTFETPPTVTADNEEWKFIFEEGEIATTNVSISTTEDSEGTLDIDSLETYLTSEEVRVVEENASYLNLTKFRIVPDGEDVLDDVSSDKRNTVKIETPFDTTDPIPEGEYVFNAWATEWLSGGVYRVEWEIVKE